MTLKYDMMTGLMLVLTAVRYVDPSSHGVFPQPYDDAAKTQRPLVDFIRLRHLKYMKIKLPHLSSCQLQLKTTNLFSGL